MKSTFGLIAAIAAGIVYAATFLFAVRAGAGWLDAQGLFLMALPYNWTMLRIVGVSNFSLEAPGEILAAGAFDMALVYLAGALIQTLLRALWRGLGLFRRRA